MAESRRAIDVFSSLNEEFQLHLIDHKIIRTPKIKKISVDFYHFGEIDIIQSVDHTNSKEFNFLLPKDPLNREIKGK